MLETRATITSGGRLVIPAAIRKKLHINIGEEVILKVKSGELHITSLNNAIKEAQVLVQKYNDKNTSLSKALISSRREESKNE